MKYAGDITPLVAWDFLSQNDGVLVDVRSTAELASSGAPVLAIGHGLYFWNPLYEEGYEESSPTQFVEKLLSFFSFRANMLFLCRSGVRSKVAANLASEAGFALSYNIKHGLEGPLYGWKESKLPWSQE